MRVCKRRVGEVGCQTTVAASFTGLDRVARPRGRQVGVRFGRRRGGTENTRPKEHPQGWPSVRATDGEGESA